jgi:cytochrome bd-type quinol oxidase subunit 2
MITIKDSENEEERGVWRTIFMYDSIVTIPFIFLVVLFLIPELNHEVQSRYRLLEWLLLCSTVALSYVALFFPKSSEDNFSFSVACQFFHTSQHQVSSEPSSNS